MNSSRPRLARLAAASALLAVTIGAVATSGGEALGPVVAVTPFELTGSSGYALNPVLSGRGETAGVFDGEINDNGWALFDVPGPELMSDGAGVTVSGNGCASLRAVQAFSSGIGLVMRRQVVDTIFLFSDRCRGIADREVYRNSAPYSSDNVLALSHNGRFGVLIAGDFQLQTYVVLRVDTETLALAQMPFPANYNMALGNLGLDVSDNGNIVVATMRSATPVSFANVAAWDVSTGAVNIVSGDPLAGASAFPSVSGDGRYVSFTSSRPLLGGESGNGPWVYVMDRANGAVRRISNPADHAWGTSITRDASQVAYAVALGACQYNQLLFSDMYNCPGTRVDVAYGPAAGLASFSVETISLGPNGAPAAGQHFSPALSGNGRWVAWLTDNAQGLGITSTEVFGQNAMMRRRDPALAIDPIDFGTIGANTTSTIATTVRNTGRTSVSLDSITATPGQFSVQGGGTCVGGSFLPPGATCTVNIRFAAPNNTSTTNGSIIVAESGYDPISAAGRLIGRSSLTPPPSTTTTTTTTTIAGQIPPGPTTTTTTTSTTLPPGSVALTADPNPVDFGQVAVGLGSPIQTVTITNIGDGSGQLLTELGGANPDDFFVVDNGCNELVIAPGQSCTMQIMMIPLAGGHREASLILTAGGVSGDIAMFGEGHFAPILLATPAAITSDGTTTIIGRGFPPDQTFDVHVDPTNVVLTATADALGQFQIPLSAIPNLTLGNYVLRVDPLPQVFDLVQGQLVVVLGTFEPQGPGGPAFGNAIIVTRGG